MREYVNLYDIYKTHKRSEIDYGRLISFLDRHSHPRLKITRWLQEGSLIRIKKGLYLFGPKITDAPYSKETLSSLIYGPSALSLESALSYHGFIPERVTALTSVTPKRDKTFSTPVGTFIYRYLNPTVYPLGLTLNQNERGSYLMATPEKALVDQVTLQAPRFSRKKDLESYLKEGLRLDWSLFKRLNMEKLKDLTSAYNKKNAHTLQKLLEEAQ